MPDDAREPQPPFGSIERMAVELSIVEWQTVTQVLSLAPYVRVFKVLGEIERQAKALDAMRAENVHRSATADLREQLDRMTRAHRYSQENEFAKNRECEEQRMRAQKAEAELRAIKRAQKNGKKNEEGGTADVAGEDVPAREPD